MAIAAIYVMAPTLKGKRRFVFELGALWPLAVGLLREIAHIIYSRFSSVLGHLWMGSVTMEYSIVAINSVRLHPMLAPTSNCDDGSQTLWVKSRVFDYQKIQ